MSNYIGTLQQTAIGTDFTGVAASATQRISNGMDTRDACTTAGLIIFPADQYSKLNLIAMKLDGTAHGAAGSVGTITLTINSVDYVIEPNITNEPEYFWQGQQYILPPGSRLAVAFNPVGVTTIVQQLTVIHEPYRRVNNGVLV